ncbi:amino acid ABC transporter permease [Nonomuraea sp. NPDC005650]|uniref:amino acid ABC transporter permease n=1 Tax=Nonomuraea sp. NPDC005650 TaxID=3157045 RepID=UPI0033B6882C
MSTQTTARLGAAGPDMRKRSHPLRWVAGVLIVAVVAGIVYAMAQAKIIWPDVANYIVSPNMLQAVWKTVLLAVVSQVIAVVLGVIVAVLRISANPVARNAAWVYIWLFRGVPVLLQILIWYNLSMVVDRITIPSPFGGVLFTSTTNDLMTPFMAALLGLALNESAYMAEIIRSGIKSVDHGQIEAAGALGMSPARTMCKVVLPQAMRVIIPPTGNDFINMLKTTSLASVITYEELLRAAQNISSRNLQVMETLFAAGFWYMVVVSVTSVGQYYLERAYDVSAPGARSARASILRTILRPPMKRSKA